MLGRKNCYWKAACSKKSLVLGGEASFTRVYTLTKNTLKFNYMSMHMERSIPEMIASNYHKISSIQQQLFSTQGFLPRYSRLFEDGYTYVIFVLSKSSPYLMSSHSCGAYPYYTLFIYG